jgi:hypothetical protein
VRSESPLCGSRTAPSFRARLVALLRRSRRSWPRSQAWGSPPAPSFVSPLQPCEGPLRSFGEKLQHALFAIIDAALDVLARGVVDIHEAYNGIAYLHSWVDDPWVHGSYAGFTPGQYTGFWGFLEKPEGNALFAGKHTSTHSQGYLNGGVETGERAAGQVLNVLG